MRQIKRSSWVEFFLSMSIAIFGLAIGLLHIIAYWQYTMEDAYISFRYARNLANGLGLVFNQGEYVEGYTNFLWVVLLAGLNRIGFDFLITAKVVGLLAGIGILIIVWRITQDLISSTRQYLAGIPVILIAIYPGWAIWSIAGLETSLFTFFITLGWLYLIRWIKRKGVYDPLFFAFLIGLASLTRPEGPLFFIVGLFVVAIQGRLEHNTNWRETLYAIAVSLLLFTFMFGGYMLWRYSYYGYWLPNTYYLKVPSGSEIAISQGYGYILGFWESIGGWWIFWMPLSLLFTKEKHRWWTIYTWLCLGLWLYYIHSVNGDWMPQFRFFVPILPLITIQIALLYDKFYQPIKDLYPREGMRWGIFLLLAPLSWGVLHAAYSWRTNHIEMASYGQEHVEAGKWLGANLAPDTIIAVTNAGAIPYYSELQTIDYYGLMSAEIAHNDHQTFKLQLGNGVTGRYNLRLDVDWLLDKQPGVIEIPGTLVNDELITYAPAASLIWQTQRFQDEYSGPILQHGSMFFIRQDMKFESTE